MTQDNPVVISQILRKSIQMSFLIQILVQIQMIFTLIPNMMAKKYFHRNGKIFFAKAGNTY